MICEECANAADRNRRRFELQPDEPMIVHPAGCGCACMHKKTEEWDKQFGVKPPWLKETEEQ